MAMDNLELSVVCFYIVAIENLISAAVSAFVIWKRLHKGEFFFNLCIMLIVFDFDSIIILYLFN